MSNSVNRVFRIAPAAWTCAGVRTPSPELGEHDLSIPNQGGSFRMWPDNETADLSVFSSTPN